jgi:predicted outer membrane protein
MKTSILAVLACALAIEATAAPKGGRSKKPAYPGIIQMTPPTEAAATTEGKIISSEVSGLDLRFLQDAATAGLLQSHLGELAQTKGSAEQVRKVGASLAATQAEENQQLQRLALRKGIPVPTDPATVRSKLVGEIETLDGLKFDKVVLEQFMAVNRLAVAAYEAGVNSQDPDIRAFVGQMLPVAKARLQLTSKMAGAPAQASTVPKFRTSAPPTVQ